MNAKILIASALALWLAGSVPAQAQSDDNSYGFDIVDKTGKGYVTLDEFMAVFEDKTQAQANFQAMDANGDGILTKQEFLAAQGKQ